MIGATVLAVALSACGGGGNGAAQSAANTITKSVYANDTAAVQSDMDAALKAQVTRASVGIISDKMHKLGDYKGLTLLSTDAIKNEYTFRGDFGNGSMNVVIKLDPDGKAAAYRVIPT